MVLRDILHKKEIHANLAKRTRIKILCTATAALMTKT